MRKPRAREAMPGGSVWFRVSAGHQKKAEARWLLPMICRRGGVNKNEIGAIRIYEHHSEFEISALAADKFKAKIQRPDKEQHVISALPDDPQGEAVSVKAAPPVESKPAPADRPRFDNKPHGDNKPSFDKKPVYDKKRRFERKPAHAVHKRRDDGASFAKPAFEKPAFVKKDKGPKGPKKPKKNKKPKHVSNPLHSQYRD